MAYDDQFYSEGDTGIGDLGGFSEIGQSIPFINLILGPLLRSKSEADKQRALGKIREQWEKLNLPQFSSGPFTPDKLKLSEYADPEKAKESLIEIDPELRNQQIQALKKIQDLNEGYGRSVSDAERRGAIFDANRVARGRDEAALAQAQTRGVGGGGLEFALRQQGSQDAANRSLQGGLQGAQAAALQRLQGNQQLQQGLGSLRNQDTDLASRNADILNRFNLYNTDQLNRVRQGNIDIRNKGGLYNTQTGNQARMWNIDRRDRIDRDSFNAALQRLAGMQGATQDIVGQANTKTKQDIEKAKENEAKWESIMQMGGGGGGGMGGGGGFDWASLFGGG